MSATEEQQNLLRLLVHRLEGAGITYMISGSLASSLHGEPRMTRDIDIVVDAGAEQLEAFASGFDFSTHYVTDPLEALDHQTMFTVVEVETGWKVDLVIRKDRPFSREELQRRVTARIGDLEVQVVSAEDSILSKLEWAKLSHSKRQLDDAAGVIAANRGRLDWFYLRQWAADLGVDNLLSQVVGPDGELDAGGSNGG